VFDGEYRFIIEGILKAQGTVQDSIIFDIYEDGDEGCGSDEGCLYDFTDYGSANCDTAWDEFGADCATLESIYDWDCTGCNCEGDCITDSCGDGVCTGNEDYYSCPDDCLPPGECAEGQVLDCDGSDNCCQEGWIGDDVCDDGTAACDLTCYDNDGGGDGGGDGDTYLECSDGSAEYEDCDGTCFEGGYLSWLGDGFCDDGTWGLVFTCNEYGNDCGDCDIDNDPYGVCDDDIAANNSIPYSLQVNTNPHVPSSQNPSPSQDRYPPSKQVPSQSSYSALPSEQAIKALPPSSVQSPPSLS
jgi:hypothetical protein